MTMSRILILPLAAVLACGPGSALAQQTADSLTNCHTPGTSGSAPVKNDDAVTTGNAQDVEKSAILLPLADVEFGRTDRSARRQIGGSALRLSGRRQGCKAQGLIAPFR